MWTWNDFMTGTLYLCIVKWPNGTEGLLFPRPGNVPLADTVEQGRKDFDRAVADLKSFVTKTQRDMTGTSIRLCLFRGGIALEEYEFTQL